MLKELTVTNIRTGRTRKLRGTTRSISRGHTLLTTVGGSRYVWVHSTGLVVNHATRGRYYVES